MRKLEVTRAAYGLCQLAAPSLIFRLAVGHEPEPGVRVVIRILGARHILQALVIGVAPTSRVLHLGGGGVDFLHSSSMVALAVADRQRRKAAALDAGVAGLYATMEFARAARLAARERHKHG